VLVGLLGIVVVLEGDVGPGPLLLNMAGITVDDGPLHVLLLDELFQLVGKSTQTLALLVVNALQVKNV
jgi:hypothetical protein